MPSNRLRIIGGQFRGRKLEFPNAPDLRPTGDRIRETLFNWLQMDIPGARCLDLFAGSGALGFEAVSRGARHVTFIDSNSQVIHALKANQQKLMLENMEVIQSDAFSFIDAYDSGDRYDIVFIDPPFKQHLQGKIIEQLQKKNCCQSNAKLYLESSTRDSPLVLPEGIQELKRKVAGSVCYQLCELL